MKILVIDDEPQICRALRAGLERNGYQVLLASSGEEGLDTAALKAPDMVILDLAMPGMTGWQVARAVKARAPEVHIVLMSGFGVEVAPEELGAHGVDLVLAKPLQIRDVMTAVSAILRARGEGDGQA